MMKSLNKKTLQEFLREAGRRLKGDWLLVGGTVLPAVGIDIRATVDIDLVRVLKTGADMTLELMELAEALGLPVDTINQAASFFVHRAGFERSDLLPLYKGKNATIFRPSVRLYWKLKLGRLSETDVIDCEHYLQYCRKENDQMSRDELLGLTFSVEAAHDLTKKSRLEYLRDLLQQF